MFYVVGSSTLIIVILTGGVLGFGGAMAPALADKTVNKFLSIISNL